MKLAFSTLGCPDWSFEQILGEAQKMGYDAIEIRGIEGRMAAEEIEYFKPGRQQDTKRALKAHGLKICGFGSSLSFQDTDRKEEEYAEGCRAIDVCSAMDIPYVRVFGDRIPAGRTDDEAVELVKEGIERLCRYAEDTNVGILLEVHGNFNTVSIISDLLTKLTHEKFGILWDIQHSDKTCGDDYLPFYEAVKPRLRHVHIKDHHRAGGEFKLCPTGEGDIPVHEIVKTITDGGYDGYFSLEWEKKWHPELPDCSIEFPAYPPFMRG